MARYLSVGVFIVFATLPDIGFAQDQQSDEEILRSLDFRAGTIALGDDLAAIAQTDNFRFLGNQDTQTFLTKIWGNPPGAGSDSLGMLLPIDPSPFSAEGWAVLISYDASGYVSDEEADDIDYDDLMVEMQKSVAETSAERVKQGYERLELLGWAKEPYYDATAKKLHWAKRLRFGGAAEETLNYEIRVLGRHGVLDLNVIASMESLNSIDRQVDGILSMVHFNKGKTYAEYDPDIDKVAAYGLAGLIAGGILTKAGFFKGLIALLVASKKLVAVGVFAGLAAVWGAFKGLFRRKSPPPSA